MDKWLGMLFQMVCNYSSMSLPYFNGCVAYYTPIYYEDRVTDPYPDFDICLTITDVSKTGRQYLTIHISPWTK